ncbi:Clp protease N-terminal domain-containing protein [Cellulomonas palmilytica]|uniref:Clp protease N-terminal domain-containing protein n=1 Tax=Cellulomonas palmilytica TaxID=2608402 RepID=UPI001F44FA2C|nr:Clp protease N-terminal domain-containing protein [Cellulomonas palmilytica]UJP39710.1 Clp protease [Cellulomonas palmilytica]
MFERFARDARAAVTLAQDEAGALGAPRIDSEHVLLAAVRTDGAAQRALSTLGVRPDDVAAAVHARQGLDDDALASIGVDLTAVRAQVESTFGSGALDAGPPTHPKTFTPGAKKLLEVALREAVRTRRRTIDTGHLLLAAVRLDDTGAHAALSSLGLADDAVRDAVTAAWAAGAA